MRIIAYTYEADFHCIDCTVKRYKSHGFFDHHGEPWHSNYHARLERPRLDSEGVHVYIRDNEGNLVHPVFSTDEWQELDESYLAENPTQYLACGDCHEIIETYTVEGVTA